MQKSNQIALIAVATVVIAAGTFVGVVAAHDDNDTHSNEPCEGMGDDSPMRGGKMGGMMGMSNECPMHDECETTTVHDSGPDECGDSPME